MIASFDIGFVKMAVCIIDQNEQIQHMETFSIKPEQKGKDMAAYQTHLIRNINNKIKEFVDKYKITNWLLEMQMGQYSAKQIEMCLQACVLNNCKEEPLIKIITPKCKLSMIYDPDFKTNQKTKKYNQNKNQAVANAQAFLNQTKQDFKVDRDQSDALLQALYYIKQLKKSDKKEPDNKESDQKE